LNKPFLLLLLPPPHAPLLLLPPPPPSPPSSSSTSSFTASALNKPSSSSSFLRLLSPLPSLFAHTGTPQKPWCLERPGETENVCYVILRPAAFMDWSQQGFRSTKRYRAVGAEGPCHDQYHHGGCALRLPHFAARKLCRHRSAILHTMSRKIRSDVIAK